MSYVKSNPSPSTSAIASAPSTSRAGALEEPLGMSRFISNIMEAISPACSFTATPSSTLNDWPRAPGFVSASPPQNPIGPISREYHQSNNNIFQQRNDVNGSPSYSGNASSVNNLGMACALPSTSPPQNPNGSGREYNNSASNQFLQRDDSPSSSVTTSTISITCFRCEERPPTTRCLECNDLYCYECCHSITSDCQLREHTLLPIQQSPPGAIVSNALPNDKEFLCDMHPEPIKYYCESCAHLICQDCILWAHKGHEVSPIRGASDTCRIRMFRALENGRNGTKAVKAAIDRAVAYSKSYEKESSEVSAKIKRTIRFFIHALETREKDLLDRVEKIKLFKLNELSDQMNTLRGILAGLAHTNETLVKCLDLEGIDLFVAKEKGVHQMQYYASTFHNIRLSDDHIIFMPPNLDFIELIKEQGDVILCPVGSSQAIQPMHHHASTSLANNMVALPDYSGASRSRMLQYSEAASLNHLPLEYVPDGRGQAIIGSYSRISVRYIKYHGSALPLLSFGREGQEDGKVSRPWGLCVNRDGNILVADRRNNRIQIFNRNGDFLSAFGCKGTGPGEFDLPAGITIDPAGRIIVIDKDNHRVQVFTPSGEYIFLFGSFGKECGQFQYPWDVAVNSAGNIAVTDTRNHRIQLFTNHGTFITKFVFEGTNPTKHLKGPTTPRGICFTNCGNIVISDFENHRLIMVDSAMTRVVAAVGREGCGANELNRPSGMVTDDDGRIIVADSKNYRVVIFAHDLRYIWSLDLRSPGLDDKDRPSDVALTPGGHIVVLFESLPDTAREVISHSKEYIKIY